MKGKDVGRAAAAAARHWRQTSYSTLSQQLASPLEGRLRLPVCTPLTGATSSSSHQKGQARAPGEGGALAPPSPHLSIGLRTNHPALLAWWSLEHFPFMHPSTAEQDGDGDGGGLLASSDVTVHVGAPHSLGYPRAIELEARNWTEGVLRGEAHAHNHFIYDDSTAPSATAAYLSPTRWFSQLLLDGFVSQRLMAHTGVTTASMLNTRQLATRLGRQLPVHQLSPYFGASESLDAWCLFGESSQVLPRAIHASVKNETSSGRTSDGARDEAGDHIHRVTDLALASACLPNLQGVWLSGAVVTHRETGASVLIVGPRKSGKTTVALHCLATAPDLMLTAAEQFILAAGSLVPIGGQQPASGNVLIASIPGSVRVGLGAVLGTLHPNPALATHIRPTWLSNPDTLHALLRNSDGVIWSMSQTYSVNIAEAFRAPQRWRPVTLGPLAAVLLLDWNVDELHMPGNRPAMTEVTQMPLDERGLDAVGKRLVWGSQQRGNSPSLLRGHYLLRSRYDETQAWDMLSRILMHECPSASSGSAPQLLHITGLVDFAAAVQAVSRALHHS